MVILCIEDESSFLFQIVDSCNMYTEIYQEVSPMLLAAGNMTSTSTSDGINVAVARSFIFYGEAVAQPVILLFGLVTNIMSLVVLPKVRMTETFKCCLIALAISDMCACVFGAAQQLLKGPYFKGQSSPFGYHSSATIANFTLYFVYLMFMSVSACLVVMIAIVRNIIVLKPLKAKHWFTINQTVRICVTIFLANFVVYLPSGFNVTWMTCYKDVAPFCLRVNETIGFVTLDAIVKAHVYFCSVVYGPIIFVVYIACVISIWVTLRRSRRALVTMATVRTVTGDDNATQRSKTTGKITRMLVIILILDMVCSLPTTAYGVTLITTRDLGYEIYDVAAEIVYCVRPAYNFWVYFFNNRDFKKGVRGTCSFIAPRNACDVNSSWNNRSTTESVL